MLNYVAGYILTYLIFQSESYWRDTEGFNATVFPTSKDAAQLGDLAALDDQRAGRDRDPARADHRVRDRGRAVGALQPDALRVRGAGAERLRAGRALRRDQRAAEDPRGDGDLGRRSPASAARARSATSATPSTATRTACRSSGTATRASSSRRSPATTRSPCCLVAFLIGGLENAGNTLQGADFPAGLVGVMQGVILFCALGGELFIRNRVRLVRPAPTGGHAARQAPHEPQPARRRHRLGDRLRDAAPVRLARRAAGGALRRAEPRRRGDDARGRRDRVLEHRSDPRDELGRARDRRRRSQRSPAR